VVAQRPPEATKPATSGLPQRGAAILASVDSVTVPVTSMPAIAWN
jgi:hypothetical protein